MFTFQISKLQQQKESNEARGKTKSDLNLRCGKEKRKLINLSYKTYSSIRARIEVKNKEKKFIVRKRKP
jgi:hypothetical protein